MSSITSKLNVRLLSSLVISSLLFFSACSGGAGAKGGDGAQNYTQENKSDSIEGKFMDSDVEGIAYVTDSTSGYTDDNGKFLYNKDDKYISFSVGKLVIKEKFDLSKLNADGIIFPSDILGTETRGNTTNKNLVNLLRVLHSIDNDNDASNGILINDDIKSYLSQDMNIADVSIPKLESMIKEAGKTLVNPSKARRHYIKTLKKNKIEPELIPFITVWKTDSTDNTITIPVDSKYTYNYTVDWGDGNIDKSISDSKSHTYDTEGEHTIKITGEFPHFQVKDKEQLQLVTQWGDIAWKSFNESFMNCSNVDVNAIDTPDLINVNSTAKMFEGATKLKGNKYFNDWDVSSVTTMRHMFNRAKVFNQPLNNWDVSNVTDMRLMFSDTNSFNQPLNSWNVSYVTNMSGLFYEAKAFNQPLNNWDVSSVTNMGFMFTFTNAFNQPLDNWNVSSVTDTILMFGGAKVFNQPLNDWDVSNVTDMQRMFLDAKAFNQPLNNWNVSSVTDMTFMFNRASVFTDQDLSSWDVDNVPSDKHTGFVYGSGGGNAEPNWQ
jgi:surface protein